MDGKTIIITGGSDGIGAHAARHITRTDPGNRLILVGRSKAKTAQVAREVGADYFLADYARLDDVRRLAADIRGVVEHVDVLANNAGAVFGERAVTVDGNEKTFQVNLLAPLLLTHLLMDLLQAGDGVVINTSSASAKLLGKVQLDDLNHEKRFTPMRAYGDAKLANILLARGLDTHFHSQGIHAVAFDPGNVRTGFGSENNNIMTRLMYRTPLKNIALISPEKGGDNLAYFITGKPEVDWKSGQFYSQQKPASSRQTNSQVNDDALVEQFWQHARLLAGIDDQASPQAQQLP